MKNIMKAIIDATNIITNGIQSGANTQAHDQVIIPVNFNTIKTSNKSSKKLAPPIQVLTLCSLMFSFSPLYQFYLQ